MVHVKYLILKSNFTKDAAVAFILVVYSAIQTSAVSVLLTSDHQYFKRGSSYFSSLLVWEFVHIYVYKVGNKTLFPFLLFVFENNCYYSEFDCMYEMYCIIFSEECSHQIVGANFFYLCLISEVFNADNKNSFCTLFFKNRKVYGYLRSCCWQRFILVLFNF